MSCPGELKPVDPRVRRTREALAAALDRLLESRAFEAISVAEIAEAAGVNRATFYAHFEDKFALLQSIVGSRFRQLLESRGVEFDGTCYQAVYAIVLAVCDFLAGRGYCPGQHQLEQQTEFAMVGIVRQMLWDGLRRQAAVGDDSPERTAAALSGAIYWSAKAWLARSGREPAESAARQITEMLRPIAVPQGSPQHA